MRPLTRKLVRDLWRLRVQVLSIALVVAAGIAAVVSFRSGLDSLDASRARYYAEARFADVFATLKRAPEPLAARLAEIPGVAAVQTRVVAGVVLDVPGLPDPAAGRVVSIPPSRGAAALNRLHLRRGRMPLPGRRGEVLVGEPFAEANRLGVGDTLGALLNGRRERLVVVGVALSPEYVYASSGGAFLADDRRFGVLWMEREPLAAAFDLRGAFNDAALALAPGASVQGVIGRVDRRLARYGGLGAIARVDQPSDRVISDELRQNRQTGTVIPAFILAVAAFLLNVVLARLVGTEREQIAVLKAFGYTSGEVARHYLAFALSAVLLGAAIGLGAGVWLGDGLVGLYAEHFRFPDLRYRVSWPLVLGALGMSVAAAAAGAVGAVRRAARLPPAEAMRPEEPARFSRGAVERLLPRGSLSPIGRIIVRNLTRRPLRTAASVLGVGFSVSLVFIVLFFFDGFRYSFGLQFGHAQRQDLTVAFTAPRAPRVRHDLAHLPGVERVEAFRAVPVRLRAGHRARRVTLLGTEARPELSRVLDRRARPYGPPPAGLLLSRALAGALGVRPGDSVEVEVQEGARPLLRLPVAATVDDLFGANAYADLRWLARALGEGPAVSGAHLALADGAEAGVHARLGRTPLVAGVTSPAAMLRSFEEQVAKNLYQNLVIVAVFAGVIALGLVYNGARIALAERARELASLRVLGFTVHEIAVILLGEQGVVLLLGVPVGWGIGIAYAAVWITALNGEAYRIPMVYTASAFALSAAVICAMAVAAALAVRRRLHRLDLVAVLKSRE
ncbi:MAG TPA: FtsX-like permease family protein [Longimicrobium sp.]|nr:FtsX-like permease family protein [Longimicrobium sp.]